MFTINVKENNAVKKYICSSAKAVAAKMSELALWTKDVQINRFFQWRQFFKLL